ncbi:translation initiation factor IF-2-like [Pollicipes pollicipes]|uniref:translation initiation factor IF-2-like n=1 Tax=Pollicipes pollicipes TaxID=41117 RepID=UPI0018850E84|nr:translation initiation factor IF-2-like [Pollicipes pollicipes]
MYSPTPMDMPPSAPSPDSVAPPPDPSPDLVAPPPDPASLPALDELRDLLALHEHQMAALVEQQRRQRRALEASFRRVEEAPSNC